MNPPLHDLIIIGAGPTGIAIGAAAKTAGLDALLIDRGALTEAILSFPEFMTFFTTRDKLEIAGIPFAIPHDKPTRQDALAYYRAVAAQFQLNVALHENVTEVRKSGIEFEISSEREGKTIVRRARAAAFATGYFDNPYKLNVSGAELPWVRTYYKNPYEHFNEDVVIVGGGNSACETALDLWRNRVRSVTLVVRAPQFKRGVKYWVLPDIENRISDGDIKAFFETEVIAFEDDPRAVVVRKKDGAIEKLRADAAYAMIGFEPEMDLLRRSGIEIDPKSLVPKFDPVTCETNVPGLYVAGTLQAGRKTDQIFIENSRDHGLRIVEHLRNCFKT